MKKNLVITLTSLIFVVVFFVFSSNATDYDISNSVQVDSLVSYIRGEMVNRTNSIVFDIEGFDPVTYFDDVMDIISKAFDHTGNGKEGDYLVQNIKSIGPLSISTNPSRKNCILNVTYYTTSEQEADLTARVSDIISTNGLGDTSTSKCVRVARLYRYIISHCSYDFANLSNPAYDLKFTAYAAEINNTAVCQGFSSLVYRILNDVGIDCRVVTGIGNGGAHAWNLVQMDDGNYYYLDVTWDLYQDFEIILGFDRSKIVNWTYFLCGSQDFGDHQYNRSGIADPEGYVIPDVRYSGSLTCPVTVNHSVTITNSFGLNYYYTLGTDGSEYGNFDEIWLEVQILKHKGGGTVVERYKINADSAPDTKKGYNRYRFSLNEIAAPEIGDSVTAYIYAVESDDIYRFGPDYYSVVTYCYNKLGSGTTTAELKHLLVDMLNYCAESQKYFNYNYGGDTTKLVNYNLTSEQKALATSSDVVPTLDETKSSYSGGNGSVIGEITKKSLVLNDTIEQKFYFTIESSELVDGKVPNSIAIIFEFDSTDGNRYWYGIPGSRFSYDSINNRFSAKLTTMFACDTRYPVDVYLAKDEGSGYLQRSDKIHCGVEAYCKKMMSYSIDLENLLKMMLKYTKCANDYFSMDAGEL